MSSCNHVGHQLNRFRRAVRPALFATLSFFLLLCLLTFFSKMSLCHLIKPEILNAPDKMPIIIKRIACSYCYQFISLGPSLLSFCIFIDTQSGCLLKLQSKTYFTTPLAFNVSIFVLQIADFVHIIYGHGTHTHQLILFMAVDLDCLFIQQQFIQLVLTISPLFLGQNMS